MSKENPNPSPVVLYQTADGKVTVNVTFARETFWLTQKAMAELFGVKIPAVNKHLKNIHHQRFRPERGDAQAREGVWPGLF